jgi:hypothetical protein
MLRIIIGAIGALCALAGLLLLLSPTHEGLFLVIIGALILISLVFEGRYRAARTTAGPWEPTGEKFIDPGTGKLVEVDYDPQTGERRYREPGNG